MLALNATALEKEETSFLAGEKKHIQKISPNLLTLFEYFIAANKGGKKIRGFLVRLGYGIGSGKWSLDFARDREVGSGKAREVTQVAAAYEILHTSILAHDDIIDKSPTRRGQPALYKSVGVDQTITLADLGFFLSMKIISESKFDEKLKNQALRMFSQTMVDTAIGQMMDVAHGDSEKIALLKTARYTIAGPLKLGAILGGAEAELIRELGEFGESLGIAFQIQDDILDGEVKSAKEAKKNALKYADKARNLIPKLTDDTEMRKLLEEMVGYMVERSN